MEATIKTLSQIAWDRRKVQNPWKKMYYYGRRVELVSYPWLEDDNRILINVRMIPGDPTSMKTVESNKLRKRWFSFHWGLGTIGVTIGSLYFDIFLRPYFGMFIRTTKKKEWRKLPSFKVIRKEALCPSN